MAVVPFFLITTSMDTDRGLARLLPPPPEDQDQQNTDKIKERNVLQVYLNKDDALMCGNDYISVDELRERAKEFIANVANAEHMPEKTQKNVEFFGTYLVNDKHVISLQNDRGSSYQAYISVQNELVAAYNELRDELAQEKWQLFSAHSFLLVQFLILVHRITLLSRGAMSGAWDRAQRKGMNPTPHTAF